MKLKAYAKINLFLDVLGKREDGFHELRTVMQTVGLCDEIDLWAEEASETEVEILSDSDGIPADGTNLAARAAVAYASAAGRPLRVKIAIKKKIPVCAGLAGGSADAAAVLRGLNEKFDALSEEALLCVAAGIGSDVPFCLVGGTKLCLGRGEILSDFAVPHDRHVVLINSGEKILTKEAFRRLDEGGEAYDGEALFSEFCASPMARPFNRFEDVILRDCPIARGLKAKLLEFGAESAAMSGSGATVFGIFRDKEAAADAAKELGGISTEFVAI